MAEDRYEATNYSSSCSSDPEQDSISILLHQFLFRASSSSSSIHNDVHSSLTRILPNTNNIINPTSLISPPHISASNLASAAPAPAPGIIHNDPPPTQDYDYEEDEEGFEALMEETTTKQNPRTSSKRSRAAEVHNLSEKRRRSRINEKMKALQNLIPNSNKTDKASMLDEAIEYLKQLQLQVQMLTMRNGLSLYPMCLPDALHPAERRISFHDANAPLNLTTPNNPSTLANSLFSLAKQCSNLKQPSLTNMSNVINSKSSYGVESSIQAQHGASELQKGFCTEDTPYRQLNLDPSRTNLGAGIPLELQASGISENKVWGVSNSGRG